MDKAKRSMQYPPQSPDLTPLDFYLWGNLKNTVCTRKPGTLQDLGHTIEIASIAIPPATLQEVYDFVTHYYQQSIGAAVNILYICEFKETVKTVS
jgi:hypothetical protein